jgi:hypothetical protein
MNSIVAVSSPVSTTPAINENQGAFDCVNVTGERFTAYVVDTSGQTFSSEYIRKFSETFKWPHCCSYRDLVTRGKLIFLQTFGRKSRAIVLLKLSYP